MPSHAAPKAVAGLLAIAWCALAAGIDVGAARRQPAPPPLDRLPGEGVPIEKSHAYRLAGRIRPLLFWFGKDDLGLARIVWRRSGGTRGYELLVGTDPGKAPRALNRWGYVAEEAAGSDGVLLALMTRSDEQSLDEAEASAARASGGTDFRALHARLDRGTVTVRTAPVITAEPLRVFDVESTLPRIRQDTAAAVPAQVPARPEARAGFLLAVAELVDLALAAGTPAGRAAALGRAVPYVFGRSAYELRLRDVEPVASGGPPPGTPLVRLPFETRNLATRTRTRFELVCGTTGELAGVPVRVEWQPRWWLRLELHLDDSPGRAPAPVSR